MFFQSKPKPDPQPKVREAAELLLDLYKQHYRLWYHHAALKKVQSRAREVATDDIEQFYSDQAAPDPAALLEQKVTLEIFERAFARLPERMRELLYCKFFENLPDDEIAERLGVQPSSLRSALSRARAALRTEIAKEEQS